MMTAAASRCAVHPARRAVDTCPVCSRPRCGVDVAGYAAAGCPACARPQAVTSPARRSELVVRVGLAAYAVALVGGWIGTQYVRNRGFSLIAPALVGIAIGWASSAAAGTSRRGWTLGIAAVASVLSTAVAFRVYAAGGLSPLHPAGRVLPPYAAAVAGVLAWPLIFGPPKRPRSGED